MSGAVVGTHLCYRCDAHVPVAVRYCGACQAIEDERERQYALEELRRNRDWWLDQVGLPRPLRRCTFETLDRTRPVELLEAFKERDLKRGRAIVIIGPTGVGKTRAAAALIDSCLLTLGTSMRYMHGLTLVRELHDFDTYAEAVETAVSCKLLVLDDLPRVSDERVALALEEIFLRREAERRATVVLSNATPADLETLLSDRVRDRLRAWGEVQAVSGPSLRRAEDG